MKLGPVPQLDKIKKPPHQKKKKKKKKKMTIKLCRQIMTLSSFFRLMADLDSETRIMEAYSILFTFSLMTIFYLTKSANRTEKSLSVLSYYCFE